MQRTIARLLLLFAFAGNILPLALAVTATPPHACCIRSNHHCHALTESASSQLEVRAACCCPGNCGHAVVTAQWAHPQDQLVLDGALAVHRLPMSWHSAAYSAEVLTRLSTRAPPLIAHI